MTNQKNHDAGVCTQSNILTVKKILWRQLLFFPLSMLPFLALLFLFIAFIYMFAGAYDISIQLLIFFHVVGVLFSMLAGFLFALKFKYRDFDSPVRHRTALFAPVLIMTAVIAFANIFSQTAAVVLSFILNPAASPVLAILLIFDQTLVPTFSILCVFSYELVFWLTTRRCYKREPQKILLPNEIPNTASNPEQKILSKRLKNTLKSACALALSLCLVFCVAFQYSEVEYKIMQRRFEMIEFSEEVDDYSFYQAFPFQSNNILARLNSPANLTFDDLETTPRLDGATAFYPIYAAFVQEVYTGFEDFAYPASENYNYRLFLDPSDDTSSHVYDILSCTKTNTAYDRLINKQVDMIFAFEPSADQLATATEKGEKMVLTPLGYDAFCFFVNTENPVDGLSVKQIKDIFSGKITNWKKVGGQNKRIFAFTRPNGSGSQTVMENTVMQGEKISLQYQARNVRTMGGAIKVVDSYMNAPTAIGYTFMYYSSTMVTSNKIKYLSVNNVAPTQDSIRNGTYIFSQPFYAITLESNMDTNTAALLDWIVGPQGQELVSKTGYLPLQQ